MLTTIGFLAAAQDRAFIAAALARERLAEPPQLPVTWVNRSPSSPRCRSDRPRRMGCLREAVSARPASLTRPFSGAGDAVRHHHDRSATVYGILPADRDFV